MPDEVPPTQSLRDADEVERRLAEAASARDLTGQTLGGRYRIIERLGEGGFATVYAAQQQEPVRRKVAVKVIKLGMDTADVIARFGAERQALALMDHPHVARVLDAGATETGRPYFVMEHVPGDPITDYCDRHRLTIRGRLDLFIQACEAVQHAHQKGIIHRDVKPSNVLVTVKDKTPQVKIIDFGIAKAIGRELTEQTVFTGQGMLLGTPAYMSPEQAEMRAVDIDTRTDIYSLGVLLYELLTSAPPFDPRQLQGLGYAELQRVIREEEPARPSTRLTTLGEAAEEVAGKRRADLRRLAHDLRGDLDWITMKALEKDRTRRYETASALAEDLRRHLRDEPVLAGPPSTLYRAVKFVRRHRVGAAATSIVALAVIAGAAATTWQAVRATRAEGRAVVQRELAERRYREARDLAGFFMEDVYDEIADLAGTVPAREMLVERALAYLDRLEAESAGDVSVMLDIANGHRRVGQILGGIRGAGRDRLGEARQQLEAALRLHERILTLEPRNVDNRHGLVSARLLLGDVLTKGGRSDEARAHYEVALTISEQLHADIPDDVLAARRYYACALKMGDQRRYAGDYAAAAGLYDVCREVVERLLDMNPDTAQAQRDWTLVYTRIARLSEQQGDLEAALGYYQLVLSKRLEIAAGDPDSARARRDVMNGRIYVAGISSQMGRHDEAIDHCAEALAIAEALRSADPEDQRARADLARTQRFRGDLLEAAGRIDEAARQLGAALEAYEALAADHPDVPLYVEASAELRAKVGALTARR